MCKRYRQRPSDVVGITDRFLAFDFDLAMSFVHRMEDESQMEQAGQGNPLLSLVPYLT